MTGRTLPRLGLLALLTVVWPVAAQPTAVDAESGDASSLLPERWLYNARERTAAGIAAWDEERFADADTDLSHAFDLSGAGDSAAADPRPLLNAGTGRLAAGDAETAAQLLAAAAESAEARLETPFGSRDLAAAAHYNLGNALFEQSDFAGAADAYRQALRRRPAHGDAKHNLELALSRLAQQQQSQSGSGEGDGESEDQQSEDSESSPDGSDDSSEPTGEEDPEQQSSEQPQSEDSTGEQQEAPSPEPEGSAGSEEQQEQDGQESGSTPEPQPQEPGQSEADGTSEPAPEQSRLPGFEDQPDMDAEQAAAILEAVENLERQRRQLEAARRARRLADGKDW